METIKIAVNTFDNQVGSVFQKYIQGPTLVRGVVHLLLILYAAKLAPVPPKQVLVLFENVYFKLFIFSLVLWSAQFSPSTSILIALAFMVTTNYATKGQLWEMLDNVSQQQMMDAPVESPTVVTPEQSTQAVQMLGQAAASEAASDGQVVAEIATVAAANVTTQQGAEAVQALAQQAVVPEAGVPEKVSAAVTEVMESMAKPSSQSAGCFPMRSYDMSKVSPQTAGVSTFEDYSSWNQKAI